MTLTPEKLAKLRELAQAATPGPWRVERSRDTTDEWVVTYCRKDFFGDLACVVPAAAEAGWQLDPRDIAYIAAANPQTVLALVEEVERLRDIETDLLVCDADCRDLTEEVERLRAKNAAYHERLHHPCEGCPGCSSNDCPDALDIAQIDLAEVRDEILRLRDSNAKVTDARDNLLDEVERLREMEATLRAIVRDLNIARGDSGSKIGLGGAYCGVVRLIGENEALRKALEEREADMHSRIRAGYDKTVADSWRTANEKLQARVAELEAAMAQRMGVYAAPKDERQVGS